MGIGIAVIVGIVFLIIISNSSNASAKEKEKFVIKIPDNGISVPSAEEIIKDPKGEIIDFGEELGKEILSGNQNNSWKNVYNEMINIYPAWIFNLNMMLKGKSQSDGKKAIKAANSSSGGIYEKNFPAIWFIYNSAPTLLWKWGMNDSFKLAAPQVISKRNLVYNSSEFFDYLNPWIKYPNPQMKGE